MLWASCQIRKIVGCACTGNAGNVFSATDFKGNRQLAIPALHVGISNQQWRGKRSRHSRSMRNPQFYVSVKRSMAYPWGCDMGTFPEFKGWSIFRLCHLFLFNILRLRQNGRDFPDDIFIYIFLNENASISIKISLKFVPHVPEGPINNIPVLVQIMAWSSPGDKPLSEPMLVSLPTHICVTRPQWVNWHYIGWLDCLI